MVSNPNLEALLKIRQIKKCTPLVEGEEEFDLEVDLHPEGFVVLQIMSHSDTPYYFSLMLDPQAASALGVSLVAKAEEAQNHREAP